MTNITTLRHFAAHAHTDEQRAAATDLMAQFDDTMGLSPVQVEHDLQGAIDLATDVLRHGVTLVSGIAIGIILTVLVLT